MNRIFCFGSSWTCHNWPTWANIIHKDMDIEVQNWGLPGCGNVAMFYRMIQCDAINNFTDDDLILVQWTSWTREDRYLNNEWPPTGNILAQPKESIYNVKFLKTYWSWENDIIKNASSIIAANKMFKLQNYSYKSIYELAPVLGFDQEEAQTNTLLKFYKDKLPSIEPMTYKDLGDDFTNIDHDHPSIKNFQDVVENQLGIKLKDSTIKDIDAYYNQFMNEIKKHKKLTHIERLQVAQDTWSYGNWEKLPIYDWNGTKTNIELFRELFELNP